MRGFATEEFEARTKRAQRMMHDTDLAALLLTTEPEFRYFTGYLTRFWESPTRPWFLIVPAIGKPVAVIPNIGQSLLARTWIEDIRTWSSPNLEDDGVALLAQTLRELVFEGGQIGIPDGHETHIRMPMADLERLKSSLGNRPICGDSGIMRELRMIKSEAEVEKIETACAITGRAFSRVPEIAREGTPLDKVYRDFQSLCLQEGADWVPFVAGGAEQGGYSDVISPATPDPLCAGDVMMLDTGVVYDGYFSDFDRNWSVGCPSAKVKSTHALLIEASDAGAEVARPGQTAADLFNAMNAILSKGDATTDTGRLGHGLGMSLTEWPSLIPKDFTVLKPGMVLTLEPSVVVGDKIMVHEENILVTEGRASFLSPRIGPEIAVI